MPFETIKGSAKRFNREGTLAGTAFRAIGGSFTASESTYDPVTEPVFPAGGDLDVDTYEIRTGGESVRSDQEKMKIKSLAHRVAHAVVKASNATDPTEFNGLQTRCVGTTNLLAAGSTSGGDALSLAKLDEVIELVPGANALLMSMRMQGLISAAARNPTVTGYITWEKNALGQRTMFYNGLQIITVGSPDHVYSSLSFTEANPGGGSAVGTSIYAVRFAPDGVHGIQSAPMAVTDLGQLQSQPAKRTRVEWDIGLVWKSRFAASRLWGIKNAAVVA